MGQWPGLPGYDAGKKGKGKKRHLLIDTLGLILSIVVHPADVQDRDSALLVPHVADPGFYPIREGGRDFSRSPQALL